jgi:hypothetical protein
MLSANHYTFAATQGTIYTFNIVTASPTPTPTPSPSPNPASHGSGSDSIPFVTPSASLVQVVPTLKPLWFENSGVLIGVVMFVVVLVIGIVMFLGRKR